MRSTLAVRQAMGAALLLGACASNTELVNSWKNPSAAPHRFNKVLAVFISKDAGLRQATEKELARRLGNAVAAYTVLPDSLLRDSTKAPAWVKQAGFDGAVVLRPVSVDQETTYTPGQAYVVPDYYGSMSGYWGIGWGYVYDPGRVEQDQFMGVEANVYSVADDKLVWASRTRTKNPESVHQLVNEIVDATVKEMKRQKVL
ncbi:MAG TPA: hypothetical protein VIG04_08500 [Gemmatimonadales bacterium]|jgi:hypothetical protein